MRLLELGSFGVDGPQLCTARNICGGITRQLYVARPPTQFLDNTASPSVGRVVAIPQLGGLHHRYERKAALRPSPSHTSSPVALPSSFMPSL